MSAELTPKPILRQPRRTPRTYTLEEYLRREARAAEKHEFIAGKIFKMPYAKGPHNIIAANVMYEMISAFDRTDKQYIVVGSDQKIYFPSLNEGVYADALAVCDQPVYWDTEQLLLINPLLVVEVLSQSTSRYDRTKKFDKYKTLDTFREYVMLRQDMVYAEVWYRERPGFWHETIVTDLDGHLPLQAVGVSLPMQRLYRNVNL
ncbi:MAG: Uma2 family endonuclease [Bacteroidia bacterium]|nr:Uma2 family endonuclease [Bacteroidia bacterium]